MLNREHDGIQIADDGGAGEMSIIGAGGADNIVCVGLVHRVGNRAIGDVGGGEIRGDEGEGCGAGEDGVEGGFSHVELGEAAIRSRPRAETPTG